MSEQTALKAITNRAEQQQAKRVSKAGKKQKNLYLSAHARELLALLSHNMGISETAVAELLIREKAARDNIVIQATEVHGK